MNGIRLSHLLIAAGLLGLTVALMATLLILPEIQALRLLCESSRRCGTWTSVPGGRDILIVLVVTYLVPALTLVAGAWGAAPDQTSGQPPATRTESSAVRAYRESAAREREKRVGEQPEQSED